ncbi:MAG: hypothetical protein GEV09_01400 [Pseudonocardiaceae bacterium]|nr:hypothetical protein [Pseudonocardiaceae bacterium]
MTPAVLADLVRAAAHDVLDGRGLDTAALPSTVTVERPRDATQGHYATNLALQSAKQAGVALREFAGWLAEALRSADGVASVQVAGPGFVNLRLAAGAQAGVVGEVLAAGSRYGIGDAPDRFVAPGWARTPAGTVMTAEQLVEEIGADAAHYALLRSGRGTAIDVEPWSRHTDDNPVFFVQYAHSRLASLVRNGADLGVTTAGADLGLLIDDGEDELIRTMGEFGSVVAMREPHRVARYLERLAGAFHRFHGSCRILPMGDEEAGALHSARVALCDAARQVLANGLRLLGVTAPERM